MFKCTIQQENSKYFNKIYYRDLCDQTVKGLDRSRRHQGDLDKIYTNYFLLHFDNDPHCLQLKVYFDIAFFLGKWGQEGMRQLKKDSFDLKVTSEGKGYLELKYNESIKKLQGDNYNEMNEQPILLAQPGKHCCPVNSFKLYLSKLTKIEPLFQALNPYFKRPTTHKWYKASPVGGNTIGKIGNMSKLRSNNDLHKSLY